MKELSMAVLQITKVFLRGVWVSAKLMNTKLTVEEIEIYAFKMSYLDTSCLE